MISAVIFAERIRIAEQPCACRMISPLSVEVPCTTSKFSRRYATASGWICSVRNTFSMFMYAPSQPRIRLMVSLPHLTMIPSSEESE